MRLMVINDTHVTYKNPSSRVDVYHNTILNKFGEVGEIIRERGIDRVIHGGDLFESYNISLKFAGTIANIMRTWGVPIDVVPGNHDLVGYNIKTLDQTMLGLFANTGVIKLLTRANPLMFKINGKTLTIEGQEYYKDIDTGNKEDYVCNYKGDLNILITHSMLLDKPFMKDVRHTVIKDIETNADILISGHYHPGYKTVKVGNTTFINPGSLLRNQSGDRDMPKVVILDINDDTFEFTIEEVYLECAKPREQVFDLTKKEFKENTENFLEEFKENIREITNSSTGDITKDLLELTAKDNEITNEIKDLAYDQLQETQASDDSELKGYVKKDHEVKIKSVEIKNFQSHTDTVIDFDGGYNCIIGRNGKGKSSIIRAIEWCLTNNLKGDYFITTGEEECSVKITLTDNSSIERYRSRKSAGGYKVTTYFGEVLELKGFGSDIPIDVVNEHQMPFVKLAKGLVKVLNIAEQSENTFLIEESPSAKASAVGKIVGNDNIDLTIKNVSAKITSISKDMKSTKNMIKTKQEELKEYDDLEAMKDKIDKAENLIGKYNKVKEELAKLQSFKDFKAKIDNDKIELSSKLEKINEINIEEVESKIEYANEKLLDEIYELVNYAKTLDGNKRAINSLIDKLHSLPNTDSLESKILAFEYNLEVLIEINEFREQRIKLYKPKMKLSKELIEIDNNLEEVKRLQVEEELGFKKFLKENNVCPTCNNELNIENIEHIVNA